MENSKLVINNVYLLRHNVARGDLINQIEKLLNQVNSMSTIMCVPDFGNYDGKIINNYGWLINDLIDQIKLLFRELWETNLKK